MKDASADEVGVLFETERLVVRGLEASDLDAMMAVYGDAEAMRWVDDGQPIQLSECVRWIDVTHANYVKYGYGMSAVVLRETGQVIGFCGLVHPGGQVEAEIKYAYLSACWGAGFATETVRGMLAYGAERFDLEEVIATVAPENAASLHVLGKCGMNHRETRPNEDGSETVVLSWTASSRGAGRT